MAQDQPPSRAPTGRAWAARLRGIKIPLVLNLFWAMTLLVVLAVGLTSVFVYREGARLAEETGAKLLVEISDKVGRGVVQLFSPAVSVSELASSLPAMSEPPSLLTHPMGWYVMRALRRYPNLYSAYIGFDDGRFFQIINLDMDGGEARRSHDAPEDALFAQRAILFRNDGGRLEVWSFLDPDGRLVDSRVLAEASYDPRARPWYLEAMARDALILTEPYVFHSLKQPGLTLASRFSGDLSGVFGVDITTNQMSRDLLTQRGALHLTLAVLTMDGAVMAHPALQSHFAMRIRRGDGLEAPTLEDLNDRPLAQVLEQAYAHSGGGPEQVLHFTLDEKEWLGRLVPVEIAAGHGLLIAIAAPLSDFTGPVEAMRQRSLLFSLGVLVLGAPLVYLLSHRMSRALQRLATEATRIQALDLSGEEPVVSFVTEIHRLSEAMATMKESLRTFGLYVPIGLVREIIASGGSAQPGGNRREITLMFTDIAGFTTLSEHMAPEDLMVSTSDYFEEMTAAIRAHKGVIDKFIGDAVMVLWNAPGADPAHAHNACLTALAARERVRVFCRTQEDKGAPPMRTRFGIHTGPVVVGNVGSSDRMNYSAVGGTVNLASRLEGLNKDYGTEILISAGTRRKAGPGVVTRWVDVVTPKGATEPMAVYELVGLSAEAHAAMTSERLSNAEEWQALGACVVSDADRDYCTRWDAAQTLLHVRKDREGARRAFAALARARPGDALAQRMVERLTQGDDQAKDPVPA